jgi:phage gpG-like protein
MFDVTIDSGRVMQMLDGLRTRMNNLGPVWQRAKGIISSGIAANFAAQGRPMWPAAKSNLGHPLLAKTGGLRSRAMALQVNAGAKGASFFSNTGVVGAAHQFGVHKTVNVPARGRKKGYKMKMNLPARPFMLLANAEAKRVAGSIENFIVRGN